MYAFLSTALRCVNKFIRIRVSFMDDPAGRKAMNL